MAGQGVTQRMMARPDGQFQRKTELGPRNSLIWGKWFRERVVEKRLDAETVPVRTVHLGSSTQ